VPTAAAARLSPAEAGERCAVSASDAGDSQKKWRAAHPGYLRQYRTRHPAAVAHNRQRQQVRDQKPRLAFFEKNNLVLDLKQKRSVAKVWLVGPGVGNLEKNNFRPPDLSRCFPGCREINMSLFTPATLSVPQEGPAGEGADATLIGISAQGNFPEIRRSELSFCATADFSAT